MFSTTITRPKLQTAVLKWFADEDFCFEQETALANSGAGLADAGLFDIGLVVGKILLGAATVGAAVAGAGNTGNGVLTLANPAFGTGVQAGSYLVEFIAAVVNGGKFAVFRPDGTIDGFGSVGTAYDGQVKFTIADGAADFIVEDSFTIPVTIAAGSGKVVPLNLAATDGSQHAMGVVIRQQEVPAGADATIVVVERNSVVLSDGLVWPAGITDGQKAAAIAELKAIGILVRDS